MRLWHATAIVVWTALLAEICAPAFAAEPESAFVEPARTGQKLALSANAAFTTDYVFRGFSQTDEGPAVQGGFELNYKIFYLGVWGSNVDFGLDFNSAGNLTDVANLEIDWYGGIKPVWKNVTFDIGVYYYTYPGGLAGADLDYVELKTGASYTFFDKLMFGVTNWWTPANYGETGENDVLELSAAYALNKVWFFSPSISGLIGRQWGDESQSGFDYTYWHAGLTLGFNEMPAFSLDVRYWDTNVSGCSGAVIFQCDERVVGTLTATF